MVTTSRSLAVICSMLAACAGQVGERTDTTVDPGNGFPVGDGMDDGGDGSDEGDGKPSGDGTPDERDGSTGDGSTGDGSTGDGSTGDGSTGDGSTGDGGDGGGPCGDGSEALTSGLRIREISAYQVVKIPLMQNRQWLTTRPAPLVQNKSTLVRVFVDTLSGYTSHSVRGVLTLDSGGTPKTMTADLRPTASSTDAAENSTFNFTVAAADIGPSTRISVALTEASCPSALGSASDARYPDADVQTLGAQKIGGLNVVVVPMVVGGRSPDTSAAQIEAMRQELLAYYPVPSVTISVHAPVQSSYSVSASGSGWSNVLDEVMQTRYDDRPDDDVYYYGVMSPGGSFNSYCAGGCVLGLAPQTTRVSPDQQAGLGVGFLNDFTPSTMVHELGHAHGRGHAPCVEGGSIQGVDQSFPYSEGDTGVWGWDSRSGDLLEPSLKDIMGYCTPTWISDYTYKGLATRSSQVNVAARISLPENVAWRTILLYADGSARLTSQAPRRIPSGETVVAEARDAHGVKVASPEVVRLKLSHVDDEFLYVRGEVDANWAELVLPGRTLRLDEVRGLR